MMQVTGQFLPQKTREDLYKKITERTRCTIYEGKALDLDTEIAGMDLILSYQVHGIRRCNIIYCIKKVYGSHLINRLHRFIKPSVLRKSMDLTKAIYGRHLPFGRRLELSLTSKAVKGRE